MDIGESSNKVLLWLDKFKIPLILALSGILLIGIGLLWPKLNSKKEEIQVVQDSQKANSESNQSLKIDISGAVNKPGVYSFDEGSRVEDVISLAGSFSANVDSAWVAKNLNLASKITDGQKIYIPSTGELNSNSQLLGTNTSVDRININFASTKELDTLPGVGEVTAEKIISLRPYSKVEDLLSKKAVGKSTFEKIKELVSVN